MSPDESGKPGPLNPYVAPGSTPSAAQAAYDAGRRHEAYRMLTDELGRSSDQAQKEALRALLKERRRFLEPSKPPLLASLNGVGSTLYGSDELDPNDGTRISTVFIVVMFIPLFPLGSYLVRYAGDNTYQFFGKAPGSNFHRRWRQAFPVVCALFVAAIVATVRLKR